MDELSDFPVATVADVQFDLDKEHFTPSGWETEVLDGVRAFAAARHNKQKFGWLSLKKMPANLAWLNIDFTHKPLIDTACVVASRIEAFDFSSSRISTRGITVGDISGLLIESDQYSFLFYEEEVRELNSRQHPIADRFAGSTKFYPSTILASAWKSSLDQYIQESKNRDEILCGVDAASPTENQIEFASKFSKMIASLANSKRKDNYDIGNLSDGTQFTLAFQLEIADRFFVTPQKQSSFLFLLHNELRDYLTGSGRVCGKWGELSVENGVIAIAYSPNQAPNLPPST